MRIEKTSIFRLGLCMCVGALATACAAAPSSIHREDDSGDAAALLQEEQRAAFREAAAQYLRELAQQRQISSRVVQVSGQDPVIPMYECMDYGCPATVQCPEAKAACTITHCGRGDCHTCPMSAPEAFKNLVFKQWCRYECFRGTARLGPVIGFVPSLGKNLFIGPFGCPDE